MDFRKGEVVVEHLRRSGPGGQHRNKRSTGIRLTHLPTGIVVMATEERSQAMNLERAFERLAARLSRLYARRKVRVKTRATAASKERRMRDKTLRSRTKVLRRPADET